MGAALLIAAHAVAQPKPKTRWPEFERARASMVVLDWKTGAILSSEGPPARGAPGSVIKPLLLEYALQHGIVRPDTSVYCRRTLRIGSRALPCTHPADQPDFTAETALADSCNTWFAALGRRFSGPELEEALEETHLPHATMLSANVEQRELAVLGLNAIETSPLELARAYRELFEELSSDGTVARGLRGSVEYGMANPARVSGLTVLGKTGTASNPGEAWTHGWFAGGVPGKVVVVIYVPHADGGGAAVLAHSFLRGLVPAGTQP